MRFITTIGLSVFLQGCGDKFTVPAKESDDVPKGNPTEPNGPQKPVPPKPVDPVSTPAGGRDAVPTPAGGREAVPTPAVAEKSVPAPSVNFIVVDSVDEGSSDAPEDGFDVLMRTPPYPELLAAIRSALPPDGAPSAEVLAIDSPSETRASCGSEGCTLEEADAPMTEIEGNLLGIEGPTESERFESYMASLAAESGTPYAPRSIEPELGELDTSSPLLLPRRAPIELAPVEEAPHHEEIAETTPVPDDEHLFDGDVTPSPAEPAAEVPTHAEASGSVLADPLDSDEKKENTDLPLVM
jgi:hypothetical protein